MKPYCEIVAKNVLPVMRSAVAKELMSYGLNQTEIAKKLGVSQAAVSQYLRYIRGKSKTKTKNIMKNETVLKEVRELCKKIRDNSLNRMELSNEVCNICRLIRKEKLLCDEHKGIYGLDNCKRCH
jgi:hypothetical protein